jgi:hypothetical protein
MRERHSLQRAVNLGSECLSVRIYTFCGHLCMAGVFLCESVPAQPFHRHPKQVHGIICLSDTLQRLKDRVSRVEPLIVSLNIYASEMPLPKSLPQDAHVCNKTYQEPSRTAFKTGFALSGGLR